MKIGKNIADIFGKAYKEVDFQHTKFGFLEEAKKLYNTYANSAEDAFVLYSSNAETCGSDQQVFTRTRFGRDRTIFQVNELYVNGEPLSEIYRLLFKDGMFTQVVVESKNNMYDTVVVERDNGRFVEVSINDLPIRKCSITAEKIIKGMALAADKDLSSYKVVFAQNEKE